MGFSGVPRKDLAVPSRRPSDLPIRGARVAVIGGTAGLGRALAQQIAANGGQVTVVGRTLRDPAPPNIQFIQADLSSMKEAKALGAKLPDDLDVIIFTTGIMAAPSREETPEGVERDMAVSYLNRLAVMNELAPRLANRARGSERRPRVFVMGFPGTDSQAKVDLNDLNGERSYTAMGAHMTTVAGNEVLVLDSVKRYPELDVFGLNPGLVKTDIRANYLGHGSLKHRLSEWLIGLMMPSPEQYATRMLPVLFAPELNGRSGAMFNPKGRAILASSGVTDDYVAAFTPKAQALLDRAIAHR